MIGGIDIILQAPPGIPLADLILGRLRSFWQSAVFQRADETDQYPIGDPWVLIHGGASREFFVYKDGDAAAAWARQGAVRENSNTMLHFLIGPERLGELQEVTVVCDERTREIDQLIGDLQDTFHVDLALV
jgi:hypothetical protein